MVPRTWWDAPRARDTVEAETFARRATSWMVTGTEPLQLAVSTTGCPDDFCNRLGSESIGARWGASTPFIRLIGQYLFRFHDNRHNARTGVHQHLFVLPDGLLTDDGPLRGAAWIPYMG
ncbi:hypothetical protein Pme01_05510 [Planosporangium mesophilum]|uniref:Uncharacterized protein n=1 Tax=Planosporangium mesophilum TaxID=689768 RepID=A0A8J3T9V6_9ACTN|nr:hypothetical protein Pme01_05510 [Planosporangium mesophilum]